MEPIAGPNGAGTERLGGEADSGPAHGVCTDVGNTASAGLQYLF